MASFALLRSASLAAKGAGRPMGGSRGLLVRAHTRVRRPWLDREIARDTEPAAKRAPDRLWHESLVLLLALRPLTAAEVAPR
jgi:hypothetical protein